MYDHAASSNSHCGERAHFGAIVGAVAGAVVSRRVKGALIGSVVGYLLGKVVGNRECPTAVADSKSPSTTSGGDGTQDPYGV